MKRFTLRISDEVYEMVRGKSFDTGKSMNNIVVALLDKGLEQEKIEFEKRKRAEVEQTKRFLKLYKKDKEQAKKLYKEETGEEIPEWLWDILEVK